MGIDVTDDNGPRRRTIHDQVFLVLALLSQKGRQSDINIGPRFNPSGIGLHEMFLIE